MASLRVRKIGRESEQVSESNDASHTRGEQKVSAVSFET